MLKLRKILLSNKFYLIIVIITLIITSIRLSIPKESIYQDTSTTASGKVIKIIEKEEKQILYIKNKEILIASAKEKIKIHLGDQVKIIGTFQKPKKNTSEGLFNYQKYCYHNNIFYLVEINSIKILKKNQNPYYLIKEKIKNRIDKDPYLNTFLLGEKAYLEDKVKKSYQRNGVSHLFAISGMHIALLSKMIEILLKKLKKREEQIFFWTTLFLLFYLSIVGPSSSIVRGVLFYIGFSINRIYYFYVEKKNCFFLLLSIALLLFPTSIYDVGFQYSYLISFSLICYGEELQGKSYFLSLLKVSLLSFIVSIPITSMNYYQINFLGIIYNLLFVPLISIILFPLSLIVFLIKPLEPIYHFLIGIMENISLFLDKISFSRILLKGMPSIIYTIYFLFIILFLLTKKKRILIPYFLLLGIHICISYYDFSTYIYYIDVGQGDSTLIHTSNQNILIDTGGLYQEGVIFSNTLEPIFQRNGIHKINYLILTHGDHDHMGEAINLVNHFKVEKVIFNCGKYNFLEKELIKVLEKKNIQYYSCISELTLNNNQFYFLNTNEYIDENNNSNVIYTELNGYKFMFMGDASITTEKEILSKYNLPDIDVLKVGHHGSKTSSGKEFINDINPKYSIISVGKNNRYGHPNKEVLDNLKDLKIYRTDQDGSIMFKIKNNKLKIETCSP